jgi:thiamine biosynthesis lipoprotein
MVILMVSCAAIPNAQPHWEQTELTRFTLVEYHMGIDARLVVYATNKEVVDKACEAAFKRIAELDDIMSDYRPKSELMRLCGQTKGTKVKISNDLFRVLSRSQAISHRSQGRFDITVGPLVQLWRKARKEGKLPDPDAIVAAKKLVGYQKLRLDSKSHTASLAMDGMKLDLGGIAKGYAGDEALKVLKRNGISSALIEMGGDLVLGDAPPKSKGWKVSVPNDKSKDLYLHNCAISSSGDTEQFVVIDGKRYSHVVDPMTGQGLTKRIQASIIAKNGFTSDPISTALTLLDAKGRARLLRWYPSTKTFIKNASDDGSN